MGRGNFCASGDLAMQWYIDYDQFTSEDGEHDELFQHEMVNYGRRMRGFVVMHMHFLKISCFISALPTMKIHWRFSLAAKMSLV